MTETAWPPQPPPPALLLVLQLFNFSENKIAFLGTLSHLHLLDHCTDPNHWYITG